MTEGRVGFGGLLLVRHRVRGAEPALAEVDAAQAQRAGRTVLIITAILFLLVSIIVGARLVEGRPIAPLSWLMPTLGLVWRATLGLKAWRHPVAHPEPAAETERPSRKPPEWKQRPATPLPGQPRSDRHVSA